MKNKILIMILGVSMFFTGCIDNSYDAPIELRDIGIYTSKGTSRGIEVDGQTGVLEMGIYKYMSFTDLSQGADYHTWSIDKGNAFLKGPIHRKDTVLDSFIINEGDTISEDKTVHVYFRNSGLQKVRMYNTFDQYVRMVQNFGGTENDTLHSVQIGNKWVIDTTFVIKVYDTIIPDVMLKQAGVTIDYTSTDTVYVEAGDFLNFIDNSTIGEPTGRNWFVRRAPSESTPDELGELVGSSNLQDAEIVFKKLGHFVAGVSLQRTGETVPGDYERLDFTSPIKVIPSSKPFGLYGVVKETEDEIIQVPFNGEFAPFGSQESFFEVKVNGTTFPIQSVTINAADATILDIALVDPIYRPDVITVSYLGGGTLESTDTRSPLVFTDEPVQMHNVNLLAKDIAEVNPDGWYKWWNSAGDFEITSEQAASGEGTSMKLSLTGAANSIAGADLPTPIELNEGDKRYIFKWKMFIDPSSEVIPNQGGIFFLNNWGFQFWHNFVDRPLGEWIQMEAVFDKGTVLTKIMLRNIAQNNGKATVYYDDFYLVKEEVRPTP